MAFKSQQKTLCDMVVELYEGKFHLDSSLSAADLSSFELKQITVIRIFEDYILQPYKKFKKISILVWLN